MSTAVSTPVFVDRSLLDAPESVQQAASPACPTQGRPRSLPPSPNPRENGMSVGQEEVTELLATRGGALCFEVITQELGSGPLEREQARQAVRRMAARGQVEIIYRTRGRRHTLAGALVALATT
jgi:hypothetical protein